jgi:hypothetical protein
MADQSCQFSWPLGLLAASFQSTPGVWRKMRGVGLSRAAYGDAGRTRRFEQDVTEEEPEPEEEKKRAAKMPLSIVAPCLKVTGDQGGMAVLVLCLHCVCVECGECAERKQAGWSVFEHL